MDCYRVRIGIASKECGEVGGTGWIRLKKGRGSWGRGRIRKREMKRVIRCTCRLVGRSSEEKRIKKRREEEKRINCVRKKQTGQDPSR